MRNFLKLFALIAVLSFSTGISQAQNQKTKIGHISSADLLAIMPGKDSAQKALEDYAKSLENSMKEMQAEVEQKYQKYISEEATYNQIVKDSKQKELREMQARIEEFQQTAQQEIQKKESELIQPILDKAKKAIEEVAKENAYTYVLDTSVGVVLYFDKGDDIMPLVKKKLGIIK